MEEIIVYLYINNYNNDANIKTPLEIKAQIQNGSVGESVVTLSGSDDTTYNHTRIDQVNNTPVYVFTVSSNVPNTVTYTVNVSNQTAYSQSANFRSGNNADYISKIDINYRLENIESSSPDKGSMAPDIIKLFTETNLCPNAPGTIIKSYFSLDEWINPLNQYSNNTPSKSALFAPSSTPSSSLFTVDLYNKLLTNTEKNAPFPINMANIGRLLITNLSRLCGISFSRFCNITLTPQFTPSTITGSSYFELKFVITDVIIPEKNIPGENPINDNISHKCIGEWLVKNFNPATISNEFTESVPIAKLSPSSCKIKAEFTSDMLISENFDNLEALTVEKKHIDNAATLNPPSYSPAKSPSTKSTSAPSEPKDHATGYLGAIVGGAIGALFLFGVVWLVMKYFFPETFKKMFFSEPGMSSKPSAPAILSSNPPAPATGGYFSIGE